MQNRGVAHRVTPCLRYMVNTKKNTKTTEVVEQTVERAVLVAVIRDSQDPRQATEFLDELEFLAETASITTLRRYTNRLPQPSSRIYVCPGKLEDNEAKFSHK